MILDKLVVNKDMIDNTIQTMLYAQERQELINQTGVFLVDSLVVLSHLNTMEEVANIMNSSMTPRSYF